MKSKGKLFDCERYFPFRWIMIGSIPFRKLMTKQINRINRVQTNAKSIFICEWFACIREYRQSKDEWQSWTRCKMKRWYKTGEFHALALMSYHFSVRDFFFSLFCFSCLIFIFCYFFLFAIDFGYPWLESDCNLHIGCWKMVHSLLTEHNILFVVVIAFNSWPPLSWNAPRNSCTTNYL